MSKQNDLHVFALANRTVVVDLDYECCISFNSSSLDSIVNKNFAIENALNKKRQQTLKGMGETSVSKTVYLFVTNKCNLSCEFCSMRSNLSEDKTAKQIMCIADFEKFIMPLIESIAPRKIIISGGEPLICTDLLKILRVIRSKLQCNITIQTNGVLLTEKYLNDLSCLVNMVEISTAHFSTLTTLESTIRIAHEYNLQISLSFVYENNDQRLYDIIDLAVNQNSNFLFNFVANAGSARDNNYVILSQDSKIQAFQKIAEYMLGKHYTNHKNVNIFTRRISVMKTCGALERTIAIYPDFECYPCHSLKECCFSLGNASKDKKEEILDTWSTFSKSQDSYNLLHVDYKKPCKNCEMRYLCGGYCAANFSIGFSDEECRLQKMLIYYNLIVFSPIKSPKENIENFIELCKSVSG